MSLKITKTRLGAAALFIARLLRSPKLAAWSVLKLMKIECTSELCSGPDCDCHKNTLKIPDIGQAFPGKINAGS